jgi:hypothetical protein
MEMVTAAGPPPPDGGGGGVDAPGDVGELLLQPTVNAAIKRTGNADAKRMETRVIDSATVTV